MYRSARVAITAPDDKATAYLGGTAQDIPSIGFGSYGNGFEIALHGRFDHAAWLRDFAVQIEELAEQIEQQRADRLIARHTVIGGA